MSFDVAVEHLDGTVLVCPIGELDLETASTLERVLERLICGPLALEIDLSGVTFADCAGLRPIRQALRQGSYSLTRVRLSGGAPAVQRVLELTGLHEPLTPAD